VSGPPSVSVVVPAFQNAAFVEDALEGVLSQTYRDLEVVVADHSSTDGTWELLQRFADDPRVVLLRTPSGGGAERNWRRVTEAASGTYLKLLCGDDLVYPTCVEEQVRALEAHPGAVMAACRRDVVDASGAVLLRGRGLPGLTGLVAGSRAVRAAVRSGTNVFGEPACVLLRRELVLEVGGWSAEQPYLIDEDLYVKVLAHGDLVAQPDTLAAFRLSDTQWSVDLAREQARQAKAFLRRVQRQHPAVVTSADVRLGSARAVLAAVQRRAAYVVWSRRMRAAQEKITP
jgi:glycosyltransferase involved in cell wall biosynthesis